MIGEIGGPQEVQAGIFARDYMSKPVIAYIAGLTAPEGRRMGHAGAIISSAGESAAEKVSMLKKWASRFVRRPRPLASPSRRCWRRCKLSIGSWVFIRHD